jgi:hypothetical protein
MSFLFRRAAARLGGRAPDEVAGSLRVLAKSDADPVAVPPGSIEQNCEVTIKEGMLDRDHPKRVVDKSAAIAVNSYTWLDPLSS